jgi:predicted ATPase/DNA-binding SARP family transcriptional activator/uncharacterized protein HemY
MMFRLNLLLLGPPFIESQGKRLKISRRKAFALLAYLAVTGEPHSRETLATLLWPESDPALSHSYLRRDLAVLNKNLGPGWMDADRDRIALVQRDDFWLDVTQFRQLLATWEGHDHPSDQVCPACMPYLSQAVALFRGDFMQGFSLTDSGNFDDWQFFTAEELRRELVGALVKLMLGHTAQGAFEEAIDYAHRWLEIDPLQEPAHRQLMKLYAWSGNHAAALRQYRQCAQMLEQELGEAPEEATRELYEDIRRKRPPPPPLWGEAPVPWSSDRLPTARHNLPVQPTPFIGRNEELAEIRHLLLDESACRLLTLVGPGGVGKTRLALQAAFQTIDAFPNGIFLVSLTSVSSPQLLVSAIGDVLGLSFEGRMKPKAHLLNYLREKEMLLILDNFEHLIEGTSVLTEMLANAPDIKLLVTSRERLGLRAEWVREVRGLDYPGANGTSLEGLLAAEGQDTAKLEDYSAISFFIENAQRIQPAFWLSAANQGDVVRICQLLDGMPLGLELAASWLRVMPCAEIAQEIEHSLDFLTSSLRDIPTRHSSLRATFDYSWQLLSEEERSCLSQLSVFRGGFHHEAAQYVTRASLPLLASLVDNSVLSTDASSRYDMHEVLRHYAADKLEQSPEQNRAAHDRHCDYYATFMAEQEPYLRGGEQRETLIDIAAEIGNVRAAWRWAADHGKVVQIGQSLESLYLYYDARSWVQEGEEAFRVAAEALVEGHQIEAVEGELVFGQLLARQGRFAYRLGQYSKARQLVQESLEILDELEAQGQPAAAQLVGATERAFPLRVLGSILRGDGDYQRAQQIYQESLAIYRQQGDDLGMAGVLKQLGIVAGSLGEYDEARRLFQEALELYRATGDQYGIANTLNDLGIVADRTGQYAEAQRLYQECLVIRRQIGHRWGMGTTLNNLGYLAFAQGEYAEARRLLEESFSMQRDIGDRYNMANSLVNLGATVREMGEYDQARSYFFEALTTAHEVGAIPLVLEALDGVGRLLVASEPGKEERAAELFVFVLGHPASDKPTKDDAEGGLADLAAHLSSDALVAAQERAKALDLDGLVAKTLDELG